MKRILSTALAISLLLGLGALAIIASPNGAGSLLTASKPAAVALAASNFQGAAAPQAPDATSFNMIAMPLDATMQFTNAGQAFDAKGLAAIAGADVLQVFEWDQTNQEYHYWNTGSGGYGTNFTLHVGGAYWLVLGSGAKDVISFVGDVPDANSVGFDFVSAASCQFNEFSVPLEQSGITSASQLAASITTGVVQVYRWNKDTQEFEFWNTGSGGYGTDFPLAIGYPAGACLVTGAPSNWP